MKTTKSFDNILKELGDLFEFNRQIKQFTFTKPKELAIGIELPIAEELSHTTTHTDP